MLYNGGEPRVLKSWGTLFIARRCDSFMLSVATKTLGVCCECVLLVVRVGPLVLLQRQLTFLWSDNMPCNCRTWHITLDWSRVSTESLWFAHVELEAVSMALEMSCFSKQSFLFLFIFNIYHFKLEHLEESGGKKVNYKRNHNNWKMETLII